MKKVLLIAVLGYAIACNSPESSSTNDATNTPPGPFSGDTSAGATADSSHNTDTTRLPNRTGPDSTR